MNRYFLLNRARLKSTVLVTNDFDKHGLRALAVELGVEDALPRADHLNKPPMEDSSKLSMHTRIAGIAFAAQCSVTAAYNFMREANADAFSRPMGGSTRAEMDKLNLEITFEMVMQYLRLPRPAAITQVLNLRQPGTNDILSVFLNEIRNQSGDRTISFRRTGVLGFGLVAVPLAEETVKNISAAASNFGW